MTPLPELVASLEAHLPPSSALLHLIRHDREQATYLVAAVYAQQREPASVLTPAFVEFAELVALQYTRSVVTLC